MEIEGYNVRPVGWTGVRHDPVSCSAVAASSQGVTAGGQFLTGDVISITHGQELES